VSLNARDRKILLILVPVVVLVAYWFLLLSPKRDELNTARKAQDTAEQSRDQAVAQAAQLEHARQTFAADYAEIVRLGKAIPDTVDSASLLIQLDRASHGTHIDFDSVTFGARSSAAVPVAAPTTQGAAQPNGNAAAGGAPAQTGLGSVAETAGNTVNSSNQASSNANDASGGSSSTTSTTSTTTAAASPATTSPALDTVALTFTFTGSYFELANFFHRLKRFVYVADDNVFVRGRLMTIDTLAFAPDTVASGAPSRKLTATVGATIYLAPKAQGATAGATTQGPGATSTGTTTTTAPPGSQTSGVPLATTGVR
jgi:hypothetical protein